MHHADQGTGLETGGELWGSRALEEFEMIRVDS